MNGGQITIEFISEGNQFATFEIDFFTVPESFPDPNDYSIAVPVRRSPGIHDASIAVFHFISMA
jgi:hypothetical protein